MKMYLRLWQKSHQISGFGVLPTARFSQPEGIAIGIHLFEPKTKELTNQREIPEQQKREIADCLISPRTKSTSNQLPYLCVCFGLHIL